MQNPLNTQFRKPLYGVLPAGGMVALPVTPAMTAQETLLCLASRPGEVTFTTPRPDAIVVQSRATVPVGFGVMIVPTNVIGPNDSFLKAIADKVRTWLASRGLPR